MIRLKNFDDWEEYKGSSEGSGRSEKIWICKDEEVGLFKFPKTVDRIEFKPNSTEYISEHLSYQIASALRIPCAKIDLGYRNDRIGCMSYSFKKSKQTIIHGIDFITLKYPSFNPETLYDNDTNQYYSYEMIIESLLTKFSLDNLKIIESNLILMMIFDMLIGNTDRHQQNWGFVFDYDTSIVKFTPLYDNGSSLCAYIRQSDIANFTGNDKVRLNSLVDSKSKSRIRIDGSKKKEPTHRDVMLFIKEKYKGQGKIVVEGIKKTITSRWIESALSIYPNEILSEEKKNLIFIFLTKKIGILSEIFG